MVFSDLGRATRVCLRPCTIYIIQWSQESALGPVLFILYINDLLQKVKSHFVLLLMMLNCSKN